jgi:hypothetical protein
MMVLIDGDNYSTTGKASRVFVSGGQSFHPLAAKVKKITGQLDISQPMVAYFVYYDNYGFKLRGK